MEKIARELEEILNEFTPKLREIPEVLFSAKPLPDKWSKKEVIGHLVDSAHNNLRRFIAGQYEENPKIIYDQDFWVASSQYQLAEQEEVIFLWSLVNKRIVVVLRSIPRENYARRCDTGKSEVKLCSIEWLASDYVKHMKHHLNQVLPGSFHITYP